MIFQCINIRQVPWEVLKTEAVGQRDLANVNAWKNMFDPYSNIESRPSLNWATFSPLADNV